MSPLRLFSVIALWLLLIGSSAFAQHTSDAAQLSRIEAKLNSMDNHFPNSADTGGLAVLFGAFCALWAQNTGRGPWKWFFFGFFFSVIAVAILLYKNSKDNAEQFRRGIRARASARR